MVGREFSQMQKHAATYSAFNFFSVCFMNWSLQFLRPSGYYDSTTASADMTNFTSLNMEIGHYYPDDGRSPYRDKEESDPLSYNSRPFNTNSFKGFSETRYDRSDEYTGTPPFDPITASAMSPIILSHISVCPQEFENVV